MTAVVAGELAGAVAVVHLLAVVTMLTGALLALRWPRLLRVHAPVAAAILLVNLAGADCPLTELELALRAAADESPYAGGFVSHYLVEPLHADGITPAVSRVIYAVALTPNLLAAAVFARRAVRSRSAQAVA